jgi:hypothetical protein
MFALQLRLLFMDQAQYTRAAALQGQLRKFTAHLHEDLNELARRQQRTCCIAVLPASREGAINNAGRFRAV